VGFLYKFVMRFKAPFSRAILWMVCWLAAASAPASVVTSLSELQKLVARDQRVTTTIDLEGVVCWVSGRNDQIILQNTTGTALMEVDPGTVTLTVGDRISVTGGCTATGGGERLLIGKTLVVDNDRTHPWRERSGDFLLSSGRHPIRVAWFNRTGTNHLSISYEGPGVPRQPVPDSALSHITMEPGQIQPLILPGLRWRSYEGAWWQIPDFTRMEARDQGVTSNFTLQVGDRDQQVALVFEGLLEVPTNGNYTFTVGSAGGAQMWLGLPHVAVVQAGRPPVAEPLGFGQVLPSQREGIWARVEGLVSFVSRAERGGWEMELGSGTGRLRAIVPGDDSDFSAERLLGSRVQATGLCLSATTLDGYRVPGVLWVPEGKLIEVLKTQQQERPEWETDQLPLLTNAAEIKRLKREDALRGYPVKVRGVVTWATRTAVVLQDATSGVFVDEVEENDSYHLREGELWEVEGITVAQFSPMILARRVTRLGRGVLPPPVQPAWDQLMNGSLDTLYVELQGIATAVESNRVTLLTRSGKIQAHLPETPVEQMPQYEGALLRIRGCLWAVKDEVTHVFKIGEVQIHSAVIHIDEPPPAYPFSIPLKRTADLLLFDAQAALLKQVKVAGQVIHSRNNEYFLMDATNGLRFIPRTEVKLNTGDLVEVVGFPELGGPSPVLREALVRPNGHGPLPEPRPLLEGPWPAGELDATRVSVRALLLNLSKDQQDQVLGLQAGPHVFVARLPLHRGTEFSLPVGSRLELVGTFAARAGDRTAGREVDSFELLLNSPADIRLLARPPWFTLRRMALIVGLLIGSLLLAMIWITMLRRQVEMRSAQLHSEIQERERTEQLRALEAERSRIARDLHDDLGSSLTEISLLADAGPGHPPTLDRAASRFQTIGTKARSLVQALDVIVWLVNPSKDALPFLTGYLGSYAEEYLSASGIGCRLKIPVDMPPVRLNANVRHNLFLAVKEALHNIVRHAHASEVLVEFAAHDGCLEMMVSDNGKGFDPALPAEGNGLANLKQRLASVGGSCEIAAQPGSGTTVRLLLPLGGTADKQQVGI
jgi:signal transduction histidine kinase